MNLVKTFKGYVERRRRVHNAFRLMASSGVIRHADKGTRYIMSKKELQKFLSEKDEQA